ncbi:MAG: hypothetical protein ABIW46_06490, partial [Acidimicrobiales bacterium]
VSTDELAAAVAAVAPARAAYGDSGPVLMRFFDRRHVIPEVGGEARPGLIDLYLPRIRELPPNLRFPEVVVHEYIHTVQFWHAVRGGGSEATVLSGSPWWLVEGPPYALMYDFQPGFDAVGHRRRLAQLSRTTSALLRHLEAPVFALAPDATARTAVQILAGDYLVSTYGTPAALERYWYERGSTDWATAFQRAFGVPVSQFYDEFERFRATAATGAAGVAS